MKIAVCFSGQIRTGVQAAPNLLKYIGELLPYVTFFCHTWNINTRKPYNATGIARPDYPLDEKVAEQFRKIYGLTPCQYQQEDYYNLKHQYGTQVTWNPMHYSWLQSLKLRQEYETNTNLKFDFVVKLRPDLLIRPNRSMSVDIVNCLLKSPDNTFYSDGATPDQYGIIDDVMYFARPEIMDQAGLFSKELMTRQVVGLKQHLDNLNINLADISEGLPGGGYTILREESLHRDVVNEFDKCFSDNQKFYDPIC